MPLSQDTLHELVARIDERTKALDEKIANIRDEFKTRIETLEDTLDEQASDAKENHQELKKKVEEGYVKKESFSPVQRVVYGLVSIILTAVVMAIVGLVVLK